jgi:hypothetical protein
MSLRGQKCYDYLCYKSIGFLIIEPLTEKESRPKLVCPFQVAVYTMD